MWVTEFDWKGNNGSDHSQHAIELDNFYRLCLRYAEYQMTDDRKSGLFLLTSHEGLDGILMWGFWAEAHGRIEEAISYGPDIVPNKAGEAYQEIYHRSFRTNVEVMNVGKADDHLTFKFKAFRGIYDFVLVDDEGQFVKSIRKNYKVDEDVLLIEKKLF